MERISGIKKQTDNRYLNLYELDATFRDGSRAPYYVASRRKSVDALKAVSIPTVEVHISKVDEREDFRQISFVRNYAFKTITGEGFNGYNMAIDAIIER